MAKDANVDGRESYATQDDEENHMHKLLELLYKFVQWISVEDTEHYLKLLEEVKYSQISVDRCYSLVLVAMCYESFYLTRMHTTSSCFHSIRLKFKTIIVFYVMA